MKKLYYIGFPALLTFDTLAQICFKYASMDALPPSFDAAWAYSLFTRPWVYGAIFGYIGGFFVWMTLLKYAPVGPSVAASHMEIISITLLSVWLFHEPLNFCKVAGGALILVGVLCLAKGEAEEERKKQTEEALPDGPPGAGRVPAADETGQAAS